LSSLAHKLSEVNLNGSKVTYFAANLLPQEITEKYDLIPINELAQRPYLMLAFGTLDMGDVKSLEEIDPNLVNSEFTDASLKSLAIKLTSLGVTSLIYEDGTTMTIQQLESVLSDPYYELREKK
jgi:hypothetical protein